jgi:hypothetical protein
MATCDKAFHKAVFYLGYRGIAVVTSRPFRENAER